MKKRILCKLTSLVMAGILMAQSGMTALAAGTVSGNSPDIVVEETEQYSESLPIIEDGRDIETVSENEPETDSSAEPGEPAELAAPVFELVTTKEDGRVLLVWQAVEGSDGYRIYRSEQQGEGFGLLPDGEITNSQITNFTDKGAELGKLYYYKLCAFRLADGAPAEGPFSEIRSNAVAMTGIALDQERIALNRGGQQSLAVSYSPANTTEDRTVVWASSNEAVATVSDGVVTAAGKGKAKITASVGVHTDECEVEVGVALEEITLNKTQLTLKSGEQETLTALLTPADADGTLTWASSDETVVSVKDGVVTAVGAGSAMVTAAFGERKAECFVTVKVPVDRITLSSESIEILKGGNTKEISVTIWPESATNREISCTVKEPELVSFTVEDNRVIFRSGARLGKTTADISVDGQTAQLKINVVEEELPEDDEPWIVPVDRVELMLSAEDRKVKLATDSAPFEVKASVFPANATKQELTWVTSDPQVATVKDGMVKAVGVGTAQIQAKASSGVLSDKLTVTVVSAVEEIHIIGADLSLYCNGDARIFDGKKTLKTFQIEMSEPDLHYSFRSSNPKAASVDADGLITALEPGIADIIAVNQETGMTDSIRITVKRLVEEVKLPIADTAVIVGTSCRFSAQVLPEKTTANGVKWIQTPINSKVGTITEEGVFKAERPGTVTLTATAKDAGRIEKSITVTVIDEGADAKANKLSLKGTKTVKSGKTMQLTPVITNKKGETLSLKNKTIAYVSSNEKAAAVDSAGNVTALKKGTAKITATVMDGSNVSASFTVTVEQRPEEITFLRDVYRIAPGKSMKVSPTILPSNSKSKAVTWSITGFSDPVDQLNPPVKVNAASGAVTVGKNAPAGLTATLRCTSKAFGKEETAVYGETTIEVGTSPVTKLSFKKSSVELIGPGAQAQLEFTAKGQAQTAVYTWYSSNEEVISVDASGKVTALGYGTAKITVCADNAVTAACTVSAYPVKKGAAIAPVSSSYGIQTAANDGYGYVQLYFMDKSTKKKLDPGLLTFTSSDPSLVYVDENGTAYANPEAKIKKNTTVTVTAILKDDPSKRKAAAKITLWSEKQVKRIGFRFYNASGKEDVNFADFMEMEYVKGKTKFTLVAEAFGADGKIIKDADLTFSVSDSSLASIAVDEKNSRKITVTVKKPGRFKITCMANDSLKKNFQASFGAYSGTPLIASPLGTINKKGTVEKLMVSGRESDIVRSDTEFTMVGANGSGILPGGVSVESARIKNKDGQYTQISGNKFAVLDKGNNKYQLVISSDVLAGCAKGTYEITFNVNRTQMDVESSVQGAIEKVKSTFKITDSAPSVKISVPTVNSFARGTWTKLKITTKAEIERIEIPSTGELHDYYEIKQNQDGWYIAIRDAMFDKSAKKTIKGSFNVYVKGYEKPLRIGATVTAKSAKPSIKQREIPNILTSRDDDAQIVLYDAGTKKDLEDYEIKVKDPAKSKWEITDPAPAAALGIRLIDAAAVRSSASYKQRVVISKEEWRTPVEMDLTVKVYPSGNPAVSFGKTSFTLSTAAPQESFTTTIKANRSNLEFKTGEWAIDHPVYADYFTVSCAQDKVTVSLNREAAEGGLIKAGTYKLTMKNVFEDSAFSHVKTPAITVKVNSKAPQLTVKMSGKLDLINRKASTLTGTVSVSGLNAEIADIELSDSVNSGFTDAFYCVQKDNKFILYARSAAALTTTAIKGSIKVTLKNGYTLEKTISFKPTQSVPKLKTADTQSIFKSADRRVADYNLNKLMPEGVRIKKIVSKTVPAGIKVEYDNGHAFVLLSDEALKAGTYTIEAKVYLNGAQSTKDSTFGKPVTIKLKVIVKE